MPKCKKHKEVDLICPRCRAEEGAKAAKKRLTHADRVRFGRMGGRGKAT